MKVRTYYHTTYYPLIDYQAISDSEMHKFVFHILGIHAESFKLEGFIENLNILSKKSLIFGHIQAWYLGWWF